MKFCRLCKGASRVLDTRASAVDIKRKRICETCGSQWTTVEIELSDGPPLETPPEHQTAKRAPGALKVRDKASDP